MTLLELHVDVSRAADALEKIVFLLERLVYPQVPDRMPVRQATLDDLHIVTPEDVGQMKEEQIEFAERYRVVPGSEAMVRALQDWEAQQRNLYGEEWKAPEDWRAIFAARETTGQGGGVRESAAPTDPRR